MFNLFEMLQQSQNGAAIDTVAQQFGLTPRQAENAVDVLLPAFTLALQRQMQNPQVWPTLLSAMQPPAPPSAPQAFEAAGRAFAHDSMRQGADLMQSLFGTSDLSRQVAVQAAAASGLPTTILQQMMPALGTMLASGMLKTFSQEGLAGVITAMQRAMSGVAPAAPDPAEGGPFAAYLRMMTSFVGGAATERQQEPPPTAPQADPAPGTAPLPNPFNAQEMGAYFSQMVAAAAGSMAAASGAGPVPDDPGPAPPEAAAPAGAEAPQPSAASGDDDPGQVDADQAMAFAHAPGGEIPLATLFETGREVQEQYLRGLRELFASSGPEPGQGP